jgi:hypothetical protein
MTATRHARRALAALALLAGAGPALAQDSVAAAGPRKVAGAVRLRGRAPSLDGRLDDPAWRDAPAIADFTQRQPNEGAAPAERTEVRLLYDDDALYVGARMFSADPARIQAPVSRRDNVAGAEYVLVSLDTYLDRRTAYSFAVTASGVRAEWFHASDDEADQDLSWDPVWEARTRIDSAGWTAEMRIPFSQLRFVARDAQTWGINLGRSVPSRNESDYWVAVPTRVRGWASRFGALEGVAGIRPSRRMELLPYVASDARLRGTADRRNPFDPDGRDASMRAGGDLRVGLGPSLTLDATINPDFGQVEADPAVVNLSAFELTFPERRPFFVAGRDLIDNPYFYSRRIGQAPRGGASGDYVDRPLNSTILGAAKLTGRLPSRTAVGALAALVDREVAHVHDTATVDGGVSAPARSDDVAIGPRTAFGVLRVRQELGAQASTVGASLTAVHRELGGDDDPLAALLPRRALAGGVDANLRFDGGTWLLTADAGGSLVQGSEAAVARLQRSSARYFQRPDAGSSVTYDPTRTSLGGYTVNAQLEKASGRHWLGWAFLGAESPGYEINDAGRISTADGISPLWQVRYRETQPGRLFRNYSVSFTQENEFNFDRVRQFGSARGDGTLTFLNFWQLNLTAWHDFPAQDVRLTRGGPSMGTGWNDVAIAQLSNRSGAPTRWSGRVYYGKNEWGELTNRLSGSLSVRPEPRWQLTAAPNFLIYTDSRQYVTTLDSGRAETYGRRYVFGRLRASEFTLDLRANYALRPDLTLELFAQPYASSGRFDRFGELSAPRSRALRRYDQYGRTVTREGVGYRVTETEGQQLSFTLPDDDFNVHSLRSNFVLRWEYRPGSTLFVVWQELRDAAEERVYRVGPRDLARAFGAPGDHVLAVKANFWIPM